LGLPSRLIIASYLVPARCYVRVASTQPGAYRVGMAATTVKGYDIFETNFRELVAGFAEAT